MPIHHKIETGNPYWFVRKHVAIVTIKELPQREEKISVAYQIARQVREYGHKPFLLFPEKEQTLTYHQLGQQLGVTITLLKKLDVQFNTKVALLLPNIPEFILFYWGAMACSAVACPINTLLKASEIEYIIEHSEASVLVTTPEFLGELSQIETQLTNLKHIVLVDDTPQSTGQLTKYQPVVFNEYLNKNLYEVDGLQVLFGSTAKPYDEAMIIYTSGTTGKPKGVVLSHHNLLSDAHYITHWFDFNSDTRFMCILPLFHVNGEVVTLMTPLYCGGSVVLNRKFSASQFWPTIEQHKVNVFSTVPTILSVLTAAGKPEFSTPSLKFGICGAAPLPVKVHQDFETTFNIPIYEGYGLSETTCYSTFNPPNFNQRKLGSIGVEVGNKVSIWDETNLPVPDGTEGEIVVTGDNVMLGYYKNPEATQAAFAGGWFHTGDWGVRDDDGFFYILDRVKDLIIRGGENISPREVDEVLYTHPAVENAATIGIPDEKYGETVKSFVVLKPNHTATEAELIAYCQEKLAQFKCPEAVAFIDEIPKGPTGKLLRRELRAMG